MESTTPLGGVFLIKRNRFIKNQYNIEHFGYSMLSQNANRTSIPVEIATGLPALTMKPDTESSIFLPFCTFVNDVRLKKFD